MANGRLDGSSLHPLIAAAGAAAHAPLPHAIFGDSITNTATTTTTSCISSRPHNPAVVVGPPKVKVPGQRGRSGTRAKRPAPFILPRVDPATYLGHQTVVTSSGLVAVGGLSLAGGQNGVFSLAGSQNGGLSLAAGQNGAYSLAGGQNGTFTLSGGQNGGGLTLSGGQNTGLTMAHRQNGGFAFATNQNGAPLSVGPGATVVRLSRFPPPPQLVRGGQFVTSPAVIAPVQQNGFHENNNDDEEEDYDNEDDDDMEEESVGCEVLLECKEEEESVDPLNTGRRFSGGLPLPGYQQKRRRKRRAAQSRQVETRKNTGSHRYRYYSKVFRSRRRHF